MLPLNFFFFLIDALRLILRHSGGTRSVLKRKFTQPDSSSIWVVKEKGGDWSLRLGKIPGLPPPK